MENIGERLRKQGWRQGTMVPAIRILEGLPDGSPAGDDDYAMVVSQSCDLVHHDLSNEPSAVILVLKSIISSKSEMMHGRNPRLLHFQSLDGQWFEAWAWNQVTIPRDHLAEKNASAGVELSPKVLRCVLDWLAKRFTRIAFPDAFNEALRPKSSAIAKLLKKNHELFSDILLFISPFDELGKGQCYTLACYLLMAAETYDDPKKLSDARSVGAKLEKLIEECGLEVMECNPVSEATLTVAELNELVRWDYDHLTHKASAGF